MIKQTKKTGINKAICTMLMMASVSVSNISVAEVSTHYINRKGEPVVETEAYVDLSEAKKSDFVATEDLSNIPEGYYLNEYGSVVLDAPIIGMDWETVEQITDTKDGKTLHEPFTIFECFTDPKVDEMIRLQVQKTDIGYQLLFWFGNYQLNKNTLKLQAKQYTQEAYYAIYANDVYELTMRDHKFWYRFSEQEDDNMTLVINNAINGKQINYHQCVGDWQDNTALLDQLVPKHFNFKPMTDELETFFNSSL